MRYWLVLLACSVAFVAHADMLDHRLASFAKVTQRKAEFTETYTASYLDKPLVSQGLLEYRAPDHLIKIISTPKPVRYSIQHNIMTITWGQDVQQIDLDKQPLLGMGINALRDLLQGDRGDLEARFHTAYDPAVGDGLWQLSLTPRDKALSKKIQRVVMRGRGNQLQEVRMEYGNGDRLVTRITGHE